MNEPYEVDVLIGCYNHSKYLRKCFDSILCQKTSFPFRIIIGDDCSTDNSQEIIREYQRMHPDIIIAIYNEKNMGSTHNALNLHNLSTAKYIAEVESDDYWIDERRLQKQYDFLETHHEYVAVGCNYYNVDPEGNNPYKGLLEWQVNKRYTLKHYLHLGFIVHGGTLMMRNIFPSHDEKYRKLRTCVPTMGDVVTRILLYDSGYIFCMSDVMHCHRMGSNDKSSFFVQSKIDPIKYCYMYNTIVKSLNEYLDNKYNLFPLLSGRMGLVLFWKLMHINDFDRHEFKEYMNTLPWFIRLCSYFRALLQVWRSTIHVVGRKMGF